MRTQQRGLALVRHSCGAAQSALFVNRCALRGRRGVGANELLRLADSGASPTELQRPPPTSMGLGYIREKVGDLGECELDSTVWGAATLKAAWEQLHRLFAEHAESDPVQARRLQENDFVALARCTDRAEVLHLMSLFPPPLRSAIVKDPLFSYATVEELFLHLGQPIEVRGSDGWALQLPPPSSADLAFVRKQVGKVGSDGRTCIASTAHRVSVWRGRNGEALGFTIRVGRYVPNAAQALVPLARRGSVLILSKAGMGKTTLLRDLAASIAREPGRPRVVVVDTSNEIGGDGPIPMPFLGRCRRMQVPSREDQGRVMAEVIQNHSPDYLVVDEIATAAEAYTAWSVAQRGVRLIATCHGEHLEGLLQNQDLNLLVGGAAQAFLSNEERRLRNKTKKTVLERPHSSPFRFVVELREREQGHIYVDVNRAVDLLLDDQPAATDAGVGGAVDLTQPLPARLERLIKEQDDHKKKSHRADVCTDDDTDDGKNLSASVTTDGNGYNFLGTTERTGSSGSYGKRPAPGKKRFTDDELYKEITGFF